jgi:hypothetical protein
MKNHLRSLPLCASFIVLLSYTAYAQSKTLSQPQREKIEAQKMAYITQQLELTVPEAQAFWPVYNQFNEKRRTMRHDLGRNVRSANHDIDNLSDKDATALADAQIIEAQKLLDLRKEYHARFKSILPPKKVLKLYEAERGFQKELLSQIREHRSQGHQIK